MAYQTPRGTYDILPEDISKWHEAEKVISEITKLYGYHEIRTPYFEYTNVTKEIENNSFSIFFTASLVVFDFNTSGIAMLLSRNINISEVDAFKPGSFLHKRICSFSSSKSTPNHEQVSRIVSTGIEQLFEPRQ